MLDRGFFEEDLCLQSLVFVLSQRLVLHDPNHSQIHWYSTQTSIERLTTKRCIKGGMFFFQVSSKNIRPFYDPNVSTFPGSCQGIAGARFFLCRGLVFFWTSKVTTEKITGLFVWRWNTNPIILSFGFIHVKSMTGSLCGDGTTFELHNFRSWRAAESLGTSGET